MEQKTLDRIQKFSDDFKIQQSESDNPLGLQIKLLEETFDALAPAGEKLVKNFYHTLFLKYPRVKPLFSKTNMEQQEKHLLNSLVLVRNNLRKPNKLGPALKELGKRHTHYKVEPDHYDAVIETLLEVMADLAGELWSKEVYLAWKEALDLVAGLMIKATQEVTAKESTKEHNTGRLFNAKEHREKMMDNETELATQTNNVFRAAVEGSMTCIMMCDRDFKVTFANPATIKMIEKNLSIFKNVFPSFDIRQLIGTCIDIFHKTPAHQRRILNDPKNLPYITDISVETLIFQLNITATIDAQGKYIGNTLEWANVTEIRKQENDTARLQSSIEGAAQAMMMCDRDLIITYANPSTIKMVEENVDVFEEVFPDFSIENLVGTCVDIFHKKPAYQRKILNDVKNLPYIADISVDALTFQLNITAMLDAQGKYIGNTLEWANVTEIRQQENESARLQSAIEGAAQPIMMCDRELVVTYANPSTIQMVEENIEQFKQAYSGFNVKTLIGTCIDIFHINPANQRMILSNPDNFPYAVIIKVSDLSFRINVAAMQDKEGTYIGNTLEWENVTDKLRSETEVARLSGMIETAETNFMVCDTDLVITYCNPAVMKMFQKYQTKLRTIFSGFDAEKLIGTCIDQFHVDPAHQRKILSNPRNLPFKSELTLGGLEFGVNATALLDAEGNQIGNAVEWMDYNDRAFYSTEVSRLYQEIKSGHLSERGDISSMATMYQPMITNINDIIEAIVEPIAEIQERLEEVAEGDVEAFVTGDYEGDHAILKNALNNTLESLGTLAQAATTISDGDLTVDVFAKSDVDAMGNAIARILQNLNNILGQVQLAADEIAKGSDQIADSSQSLAQGATEQASALEQISASMTELSSQTVANAENANQANMLAATARKSAQVGDEQMKEMINSMAAIDESSQSISKIIKVIDEIAFQTNLLALNAAVEAARAGVHGKGFAVVANEVRNLAGRSAQAAKETTEMIEDSVKKVRQGIEIADKTGGALTEIVGGVGKVTDLVGEIAAASKEQAEGIKQVNTGLTQIEQVTQQNTAASEQSAAAAEELSAQATHLQKLLGQFTLKQKETELKMPEGITPELLAAFQQFMIQQGGMQSTQQTKTQKLPEPHQKKTHNNHGKSLLQKKMEPKGQKLEPKDIIYLDDDEFGRF